LHLNRKGYDVLVELLSKNLSLWRAVKNDL
jgi:hypothetical protein